MHFLLCRVYLTKANDRDPTPNASKIIAVVSIILWVSFLGAPAFIGFGYFFDF